jgi:ubiquinol-cytochrome c reductase core subunit 2
MKMTGLGNALYPTVADIEIDSALAYAEKNLVAPKTALVGYGVNHTDLMNAASYYFSGFNSSNTSAVASSQYHGGEHFEELALVDGVHYAIAMPTAGLKSDDVYTAAVLRELFGSNTTAAVAYGSNHSLLADVKASSGVRVETFADAYSDAGLFGFYVTSDAPNDEIAVAIKRAVGLLKEVAAGSFGQAGPSVAVQRAVEAAKFKMLDDSVDRLDKVRQLHQQLVSSKVAGSAVVAGLEGVTASKLSAFAGKLLAAKPSISALGDVYGLPYQDQLAH